MLISVLISSSYHGYDRQNKEPRIIDAGLLWSGRMGAGRELLLLLPSEDTSSGGGVAGDEEVCEMHRVCEGREVWHFAGVQVGVVVVEPDDELPVVVGAGRAGKVFHVTTPRP